MIYLGYVVIVQLSCFNMQLAQLRALGEIS